MRVSVIVPTLNEEKYIGNLLKTLLTQTVLPEIIIVDGSSKDRTVEVAKLYRNTKVIFSKKGVAQQRNIGAQNAHGELLFFLDADVSFNKHFIENCIREMNERDLDICCPFYLPFQSSLLIYVIYIFFNLLFFLFQLIFSSGAGSCIICKKDIFKKGYGFDTTLKYDDIEMIRRYSRKSRFRMLSKVIYVSDRRFQKEGAWLFFKYLMLSMYFITGQFRRANRVPYEFGKYDSTSLQS